MLSYYLLKFKRVKTVVLYKFNKKNYTILKIYKLITLLNILKKVLEKLVTLRLIIIIKKYNLLLKK